MKICLSVFLVFLVACKSDVQRSFEEAAQRRDEIQREIDSQVMPEEALEVVVRGMGDPVQFAEVLESMEPIPRFRGEFETSDAFESRQSQAASDLQDYYLIRESVNIDEVDYDADSQVLTVSIYDLNNGERSYARSNSRHWSDISAVLGYGSELSERGFTIEHGDSGFGDNIAWEFDDITTSVGTYNASNAFGREVEVLRQVIFVRGVWHRRRDYSDEDQSIAFAIQLPPEEARQLKARGLYAGVLIMPRAPYFATGSSRFTPTIQAPYDNVVQISYLIADIKGVAIYDGNGTLLDVRPTR